MKSEALGVVQTDAQQERKRILKQIEKLSKRIKKHLNNETDTFYNYNLDMLGDHLDDSLLTKEEQGWRGP